MGIGDWGLGIGDWGLGHRHRVHQYRSPSDPRHRILPVLGRQCRHRTRHTDHPCDIPAIFHLRFPGGLLLLHPGHRPFSASNDHSRVQHVRREAHRPGCGDASESHCAGRRGHLPLHMDDHDPVSAGIHARQPVYVPQAA